VKKPAHKDPPLIRSRGRRLAGSVAVEPWGGMWTKAGDQNWGKKDLISYILGKTSRGGRDRELTKKETRMGKISEKQRCLLFGGGMATDEYVRQRTDGIKAQGRGDAHGGRYNNSSKGIKLTEPEKAFL